LFIHHTGEKIVYNIKSDLGSATGIRSRIILTDWKVTSGI